MEREVKGIYSFTSSPVRIVEYENGEKKILLNEPLMLSRDYFKEVVTIAYNNEVFYLAVNGANQVGYNFLRISSDGAVTPIGPILSQGSGDLVITGNTTVMNTREMDYTFPERVVLAEGKEDYTEEIPAEINNQSNIWGEVIDAPFFMKPVLSTSNVFLKETSYAQDATQFVYTDRNWLDKISGNMTGRRKGDRIPISFGTLRGWQIKDMSLFLGWFIVKTNNVYFLYHFSNPLPIFGPCKSIQFRTVEDAHIVVGVFDPTTELFRLYTLLADATVRPYVEEDSFNPDESNASQFPTFNPEFVLIISRKEVLKVTVEQADFIYFMEAKKKKETSPGQQSAYQQVLNEAMVVWSSTYGFVHGFNLKNVSVNRGSLEFKKRVSTNVAIFSLGSSLYLRYVGSSISYLEKDTEFLGGSIVNLDKENGMLNLYYGDEMFQISLEKVKEASQQQRQDRPERIYYDDYDEEGEYIYDEDEYDEPDEPDFLEQYGITVKENAIVVEAYDKVILDTGKIVSMHDILEEVDNWLLQKS